MQIHHRPRWGPLCHLQTSEVHRGVSWGAIIGRKTTITSIISSRLKLLYLVNESTTIGWKINTVLNEGKRIYRHQNAQCYIYFYSLYYNLTLTLNLKVKGHGFRWVPRGLEFEQTSSIVVSLLRTVCGNVEFLFLGWSSIKCLRGHKAVFTLIKNKRGHDRQKQKHSIRDRPGHVNEFNMASCRCIYGMHEWTLPFR